MKSKAYLAGKIAKNDWRHQLFPGIRSYDPFEYGFDPATHARPLTWREQADLTKNGLQYVGPFFLGDDHGCFHGAGSHGLGVVGSEAACCGGIPSPRRDRVTSWCKGWIVDTDLVFCWLDSADAYGTIFEIGYAHAYHKPIFLAYDERLATVIEDTWFARTLASSWIVTSDVEHAWTAFLAWKRDLEGLVDSLRGQGWTA